MELPNIIYECFNCSQKRTRLDEKVYLLNKVDVYVCSLTCNNNTRDYLSAAAGYLTYTLADTRVGTIHTNNRKLLQGF